jgi:hypothetical protein
LFQPPFQSNAFLFELDFFGGKFFQADGVAFLLQIQRGDFVAGAAELLGGLEGARLGLAQRLLIGAQVRFPHSARPGAWLFQSLLMRRKAAAAVSRRCGHAFQFLPRGQLAFLGLAMSLVGADVLRLQVAQPVLVELDAAFVAVGLALQLQALLLQWLICCSCSESCSRNADFVFARRTFRKASQFARAIVRAPPVRARMSTCKTSN